MPDGRNMLGQHGGVLKGFSGHHKREWYLGLLTKVSRDSRTWKGVVMRSIMSPRKPPACLVRDNHGGIEPSMCLWLKKMNEFL